MLTMFKNKQVKPHFFALLIFFFAAVYITYPLIFHLGEYVTGSGDELLISWILHWVVDAILTGNITHFFDANTFYPYENTLAYSDIFITSSLLALIPYLLIDEPIVLFNFTFFSSLFLLGFSVFALSYYLSKNLLSSLLSGLLVIFAPTLLDKKMHIQILAIWFVPFAILFFFHFLRTHKIKFLIISLGFFIAQTYNSFLPGYFIIFSYLIIYITYFLKSKRDALTLVTKKSIAAIFISIALIIPIAIPYFQVSHEFDYVRDIRDTIHFGLQPEDFFYPSSDTRFYDLLISLPFNQISQNDEFKVGYLGMAFTSLVLLVIIGFSTSIKKKGYELIAVFSISLTGLLLSFGPVLHLGRQTIHDPFPIPLPYLLFYYLVPGFQGFRNSGRWEMLFVISIAIVIAIILPILLHNISKRKQYLMYAILILACITEFNFPLRYQKAPKYKDFPQVYSWLDTTPKDTAIVEMPIYNWNMHPYTYDDILRQYYGTVHLRKTLNGASGFSPPPWQDVVTKLLKTFPDNTSLTTLQDLGIDYIVVHKDDYDRLASDNFTLNQIPMRDGEQVITMLNTSKQVKFVIRFGNDYVYTFRDNEK